jgi:predicted transport protein
MEMKTMARTTCKGGWGKALSEEQMKNGTDYAWGHKNGCPPAQDGQAADTKASKAPKASLDGTIEFARRNKVEEEKKLIAFEEQKQQIDVDIERERRRLVVLTKMLDELDPPVAIEAEIAEIDEEYIEDPATTASPAPAV